MQVQLELFLLAGSVLFGIIKSTPQTQAPIAVAISAANSL